MKLLQLLLLSAALVLVFTGCQTVEPENAAERPWNGQTGWESGRLPMDINRGR